MAEIIDGKELAKKVRKELKKEVEFSGLTKMKWTLKKGSKVVNLVKVTKKPTTDAE